MMDSGRRSSGDSALRQSAAVLSPRELEYLRYRGNGYSLALTAAVMGISESTVRMLLGRVHRKLDVTSTIDALRAVGWLRVP